MTIPNEAPFVIEGQQLIVETPDVRVQILTLGSGQEIPWHLHTAVTDTIACLDGPMVVNIWNVTERKVLWKGDTFTVPPKTPHQEANHLRNSPPDCYERCSRTPGSPFQTSPHVLRCAFLPPKKGFTKTEDPNTRPGPSARISV